MFSDGGDAGERMRANGVNSLNLRAQTNRVTTIKALILYSKNFEYMFLSQIPFSFYRDLRLARVVRCGVLLFKAVENRKHLIRLVFREVHFRITSSKTF